jgi:hypothetical protein
MENMKVKALNRFGYSSFREIKLDEEYARGQPVAS